MVVKVSKPEINVREKISELDKPSGTAGQAMLAAETPQEQFNLISAGRRNLLINGAFEVFQRGAGPASPSSGNSPSTADKWNIPATNEVSEVVANDRASHLTSMLKVTANSSGYGQVTQWIENVRTAAGQSLTVSFWVKSPTTGPMRFHIYQSFGSGGSTSVSIIDDSNYFTINQANIWQRFEATVEIPSVSGKTIGASSFLAVQTGAPSAIANRVVYYSEFQAELGKVATPFEHRSYGEELALCQRYFFMRKADGGPIGSGIWYANNQILAHFAYPQDMRAAPTITRSSGGFASCYTTGNAIRSLGHVGFDNIKNYAARINLTTSSNGVAGHGTYLQIWGSESISVDAEL
jgi:hypothetical protein